VRRRNNASSSEAERRAEGGESLTWLVLLLPLICCAAPLVATGTLAAAARWAAKRSLILGGVLGATVLAVVYTWLGRLRGTCCLKDVWAEALLRFTALEEWRKDRSRRWADEG